MAPTDALFWYAESALPEFRPIIAGLYVLDRAPDPHGAEAAAQAALSLVPRLRQRVVEAPLQIGLPQWLEDEHFDPAYHMRHVSLPAPGTQRELLDLVGAFFATPLDRQRPLWESYWIDGLEGGRSAYLFKVHHSVVDGVGSVAILDALTSRDPKDPPPRVVMARRRHSATISLGARLRELAREQAANSSRIAQRVFEVPLAAVAHPREAAEGAVRTVRGLWGMLADATRSPVRDPLAVQGSGLSRRLDVAEIPLERLRKIKAALGVSINDVVLAALAGALRAYHQERHVHARELVCMVPMNLRSRDEHDTLGNRVGMFNILLPVGEPRVERRLARVVEQTRAAKANRRGAAAPFLVEGLTLLPGAALRWVARRAIGRVNVACTNVPGVGEPRWMAGARVDAIYPFASVLEGTPLVMALLSYAGRMQIGIDTDPEAIPDPHRITALFEEALEELDRHAAGGETARSAERPRGIAR
jgi:WS/DGAT/MGAT family acyltransferase